MKVSMKDGTVKECKFEDELGKEAFWHTASHVLAQAVKRIYPSAKCAIGPAIKDGFYYDFEFDFVFSNEHLKRIEDEMKKVVKENLVLRRFELSREEAISLMEEKNEPYKVMLINDLPIEEKISFYEQGEYVDLCAGPHIFNTNLIKAYKLTTIAGAY